MSDKKEKRIFRHKRIRARVFGTKEKPRLSVFRSNRHVSLQLIDDSSAKTILAVYDREIKVKKGKTNKDLARAVGELIAKKAKEKNIEKAVFDRGGYAYHGLVKEAAEGARKGGLKF